MHVDSCASVFPTALGWFAIRTRRQALCRITVGHSSRTKAASAIGASAITCDADHGRLVDRFQQYADGQRVDFEDVEFLLEATTPFRRRVLMACRQIPYGSTWTYGELAACAGSAQAARAVGSAMATNRLPILIPCHRVIAARGKIGGYSAPNGIRLKQRLLRLEGIHLPGSGRAL